MADLPFASASASPEELSKVIYDTGKESISDKLGTFDNATALTNKVIKEAVRALLHNQDKFAGEAQARKAPSYVGLCRAELAIITVGPKSYCSTASKGKCDE